MEPAADFGHLRANRRARAGIGLGPVSGGLRRIGLQPEGTLQTVRFQQLLVCEKPPRRPVGTHVTAGEQYGAVADLPRQVEIVRGHDERAR